MVKESIYLVGQISTNNNYTYLWRKEVREYFRKNKHLNDGFDIIDPCYNEWNLQYVNNTSTIKTDFYNDLYNDKSINLIVPKDYTYVLRSNGCIANLNHYDLNKPVIGSLFELAWYYQCPEKFVVGVFAGDWETDTLCSHPFVRGTVDVWCKNHLLACDLITRYYHLYDGDN